MAEDETLFFQQFIAGLLDDDGSFPAAFAMADVLQPPFAAQGAAPNAAARRAGQYFGAPSRGNWDPDAIMTRTAREVWAAVHRPAAVAVAPHVHICDNSAQTSGDLQYAMALAAEEQRMQLDMEFARALQRLEESGAGRSDLSMDDIDASLVSDCVLVCCQYHSRPLFGPGHARAGHKVQRKGAS